MRVPALNGPGQANACPGFVARLAEDALTHDDRQVNRRYLNLHPLSPIAEPIVQVQQQPTAGVVREMGIQVRVSSPDGFPHNAAPDGDTEKTAVEIQPRI